MAEALTRDLIVLLKGDTVPVTLEPSLVLNGWQGGQGVQWVTPTSDALTVKISTGVPNGFLLWGSAESSDQFTSTSYNQTYYKYATLGMGGWHILTKSFEQYTYASRQAGPLVPIVYRPSDRLVFSLRGLWTIEDEWQLSADPRGPNGFFVGYVSQVLPGYLGVQTSI